MPSGSGAQQRTALNDDSDQHFPPRLSSKSRAVSSDVAKFGPSRREDGVASAGVLWTRSTDQPEQSKITTVQRFQG